MAEIRPPQWPVVQTRAPATPARQDARIAAQKAFFEAAMAGKTAKAPDQDPQPRTRARAFQASAQAEPDKIPRPGSIIDIWV